MLIIDNQTYHIPILSIQRKADFLDKFANRTEDGVLHRELIGVYYNYQLQLGNTLDTGEYDRLWRKLTEPVEFHTVTVPGEGGDFTFQAYFSNVGDEVRRITGTHNYWQGLTVNFTAKEPARK